MRFVYDCIGPLVAALLAASPAISAQNTTWSNFESRARPALAPESGGSVIAFGGDRGSSSSLLDDTWSLTPNAGWGLRNPGGQIPEPRSGHGLGFYPGSAIPPRPPGTVMFGGTTSRGVSAETWTYTGNQWSLITPQNTPPGRSGHAVASDIARNVVLMFGGSGVGADLNDTWEWDGTNWNARATGGPSPSIRSGHAMTWNANAGRVIMFGGNPALSETWEFDSVADAWVQRLTAPGNTPPGRTGAGLAYDRFNRNVVLFGGRDGAGTALNDTWIWDPSLVPTGGWVRRLPGFNPPGRFGHAMAYDAAAQRVIMVGGIGNAGALLDITYEWDGSTWRQRSFRPGGRDYAPMAWDSHRQVAVMFGGYYYDETWELSSAGWAQRMPAVAPLQRGAHAIAYDSARRRTVVFGGASAGSWIYRAETWEWDGSNWQVRLTATSPPALSFPCMAFDAARGNSVLFGGSDSTGRLSGDTWVYDGTDWTLRSPANSPSARAAHGMAYDARRGRVVLFGGHVYNFQSWRNDTWEWDGTNWQQLSPAVSPSPRGGYLTYDEARGRTVLFGGYDAVNELADTWEWDGTNWTARFPSNSPIGRAFASIVYNEADEIGYIWGGFGRTGRFDDTWQYQSRLPARYRTRDARNRPIGPGCGGSAGIPTLRVGVGERPWLGDAFTVYLSNVPANPLAILGMGASQLVPATPLAFLGMGTCLLHANPVVTLPMSGQGALTFVVPTDPSLVQARFYHQAFTFDPPANQLGLTASDLAEAVIGVR